MNPEFKWVAAVGAASLGVSFAISALLTPVVRRWAIKRDFVDVPLGAGSHKRHDRPTAFGGGIAITVAVLFPLAAVIGLSMLLRNASWEDAGLLGRLPPVAPHWLGGIVAKTPSALAILAGALVMHLLGIVDDHRPLPPVLKLAAQVIVALTLTGWFGVRAMEWPGPAVSVIVTTLWIVALTNAFNFMDNMDGLAGGVACLTAVLLAVAAARAGQVFVPCMFMLVAGGVLGFLIYNFPPASIFMGDAGSLVVGYLLAVCTVLTTFYNPDQRQTPYGVVVPLVVFAIPFYDMVSVVIYRRRAGVSILRADRRHFSHRLVELGLSRTTAVLTIYLATAATGLPAILLPGLNWPGAALVLGQCACVLAIIALLESRHAR